MNLDSMEAIKKLILKRIGNDGRLWILDCVNELRCAISVDVGQLFKKGLLASLNDTHAYIYVGLSDEAVDQIINKPNELFNNSNPNKDILSYFEFDGLSSTQQVLMQLIKRKIYPHPRVVNYNDNDLRNYLLSTMCKVGYMELTYGLVKNALYELKEDGIIESATPKLDFIEIV